MKKTNEISTKEGNLLKILVFVLIFLIFFLVIIIFFKSGNMSINDISSLFQETPTEPHMDLTLSTPTNQLPTETKIILPKLETTSTLIKKPTNTLEFPLEYIYEGGTIECECYKCICVTKQDFRVRLTIEQDGVVSGVFEQYLIDYPDMDIVGDKLYIYGMTKNLKNEKDIIEFSGKLSDDLRKLDVVIYFRSEDFYGKRIILLYKK